MDDEIMTPDEVCAYLKINKDWLYDQVQARRIPHLRLGRQLRFRRAELLDFLVSRSAVAGPADHDGEPDR
jgi:excisionase family DNA binding protein